MTNRWIKVLGLVAAASLTAWAQRGNPGGMSGSHGAPQSATGNAAGKGAVKSAPQSTAGGGTIATRITANPGLSTKVTALLPAGTNLRTATAGFKNMGQFIAALHVSKNLNIPFDKLQAEMAGGKSLGQAIKDLNPNITKSAAKTDAATAQTQAQQDLKSSGGKAGNQAKRATTD